MQNTFSSTAYSYFYFNLYIRRSSSFWIKWENQFSTICYNIFCLRNGIYKIRCIIHFCLKHNFVIRAYWIWIWTGNINNNSSACSVINSFCIITYNVNFCSSLVYPGGISIRINRTIFCRLQNIRKRNLTC